ncbi:MAG: hypothetical protein FD126_2474, partial [Elusimicrobia bacterium]
GAPLEAPLANLFNESVHGGAEPVVAAAGLVDAPSDALRGQALINASPTVRRVEGQVPEVAALPAAEDVPAAPDLWSQMKIAFKASMTPFENLTPLGRQEAFGRDRESLRAQLSELATAALKDNGLPEAAHQVGLDVANDRLVSLRKAMLKDAGFEKPPATHDERFRQNRALNEKSPALALYFAKRGVYQMYVVEALHRGAVDPKLSLKPWEAGIEGGKEVAVSAAVQRDGGADFTGHLRTRSPVDHREIRTTAEYDPQGAQKLSRTSVIDTRTGRKIHEEMLDIAKKLTVTTQFDDLGVVAAVVKNDEAKRRVSREVYEKGGVVRVETMDLASGERTVEDKKTGLRTVVDKDGNAVLTQKDGTQQKGKVDAQGNFTLQSVTQTDGSVVDILGRHVVRVRRGGQVQGYEADLSELFTGGLKGEARMTAARKIAQDLVRGMKLDDKDGQRSKPLENWLFDTWDKGPNHQNVTFSVLPDGTFQKVYRRADGTLLIERASFMTSTTYANRQELALVLTRPIQTDREGKAAVDPRRWKEYLSSGAQNSWHSMLGFEDAGWFANHKSIETVFLRRLQRTDPAGGWSQTSQVEKNKIVKETPGTSTFGIVGTAIHETPVVGHVLKFGEGTASSIWGALQAAPQTLVYATTGSGNYGVAAAANWHKVAPMNWLIGEEGHLDRMNQDSMEILQTQAYSRREAELAARGITHETTPVKDYQAMLRRWDGQGAWASLADCQKYYNNPDYCERFRYSKQELVGTFSAFTMGGTADRIIEDAQTKTGAASVAQSIGGYTLKIFDNVGETVFNPVIWATFGVGRGVQALTAMRAAGTTFRGMGLATRGTQLTHAVLSTTLYGTWIVGGVDNLGQTVNALNDGDSAKAWKKGADFSTDLFFLGLMARDARSSKARAAASEASALERSTLNAEIQAAETALRAREAQGRAAPETVNV